MIQPTEFDLLIRETLLLCNGNVKETARRLGVKPQKLYANLRTDRQVAWWIKMKQTTFSARSRKQARERRYYVRKRARLAAEALAGTVPDPS